MSVLSPNFFIGKLRVGTVEGASCINMGNNFPVGFESHKKQNQGLGTISGDNNQFDGLRTLLNDSDIIDMLNQSDETEVPDWIKDLILSRMKEQEEDADEPKE